MNHSRELNMNDILVRSEASSPVKPVVSNHWNKLRISVERLARHDARCQEVQGFSLSVFEAERSEDEMRFSVLYKYPTSCDRLIRRFWPNKTLNNVEIQLSLSRSRLVFTAVICHLNLTRLARGWRLEEMVVVMSWSRKIILRSELDRS